MFLSSADEVRAYGARMEGGGFRPRGYRPTPYDRNDRFSGGGRFAGRGGSRGGFGKLQTILPESSRGCSQRRLKELRFPIQCSCGRKVQPGTTENILPL